MISPIPFHSPLCPPRHIKQQSNRENRQGTGGRGKGQEKVVVEEEMVMQLWLLGLGTFDGGGRNHWRRRGQ